MLEGQPYDVEKHQENFSNFQQTWKTRKTCRKPLGENLRKTRKLKNTDSIEADKG